MKEKMISDRLLLNMLEEAFKNGWWANEGDQDREEAWQGFKNETLEIWAEEEKTEETC